MSCPRCHDRIAARTTGDPYEVYSIADPETGRPTTWSVAFARELVASRPREAVILAPDFANGLLMVNWSEDFEPAHIACVMDDLEPAIIAPEPGNRGHCLIDGTHRSAARQCAGLPVLAYELTLEESRACVQAGHVLLVLGTKVALHGGGR